uniref:Uncharacterized protein n=1 Tax=Solanum lycopersicum TaxID=4081 RepID=K4C5M9_SOLLC
MDNSLFCKNRHSTEKQLDRIFDLVWLGFHIVY